MINVENFIEQIDEIKSLIPSEVSASEGIIRQKEAIIKQAEDEAERIRRYADEEAVKINDNASNKAESLIQNAKDEAYKMITNTEIVTASKNAAQEIEDKANKEAESIIEQGKNEANSIINDAEIKSVDKYAEYPGKSESVANDPDTFILNSRNLWPLKDLLASSPLVLNL